MTPGPGVRGNPLVAEGLRGILGCGKAHTEYLLYLFLQAVVLFLWWPKGSLFETLEAGDRPDTLLVSVVAMGIAVSWYAARAGAAELLLPGQAELADWATHSALPVPRILAGHLGAGLAQSAGLVVLSLPLVLCGFGVSGGEWRAVGWCAIGVVFMATLFRLAAAAVHLAIGQRQTMTLVCVRATVVVGYLAALLAAPAASHVALSATLLDGAPVPSGLAHPGVQFLAWIGAATAVVVAVLHRQLTTLRRGHGTGAT